MEISVYIVLNFLALTSNKVLANCLEPYNAVRYSPGWDINARTTQIHDGMTGGCNNRCGHGQNSGEFSRGISAPHIFGDGPGFGPVGYVSGVGVPNNFWGGGYPGNLADQGVPGQGELSYVPSDAMNPMLNFWGGSFPQGVNGMNGVPENLGGLGGFAFDASQGGFPGFNGFGGPPGFFGPPIGTDQVIGQSLRGLNVEPAAFATPSGRDAVLDESARVDVSGSKLINALDNGEGRGSSKKSDKHLSRNKNRNRNVNMNFNQA